jgi:hypothetical protein
MSTFHFLLWFRLLTSGYNLKPCYLNFSESRKGPPTKLVCIHWRMTSPFFQCVLFCIGLICDPNCVFSFNHNWVQWLLTCKSITRTVWLLSDFNFAYHGYWYGFKGCLKNLVLRNHFNFLDFWKHFIFLFVHITRWMCTIFKHELIE